MLNKYLDGHLLVWQVGVTILDLPFTGSAYRAPNGEVVWIDPPEPGAHEEELLALGTPDHILITFRDHDRAVEALRKRYGAKFWAPKGQSGSLPTPDETFDASTPLPAGLRAIGLPAVGYDEHALVTEAYGKRFAFIGDAFFNFEGTNFPWLMKKVAFCDGDSPLKMKRIYRGGDTAAAPVQLRKLLNEKLDVLFLSHGQPVINAQSALEKCLRA